MATSKAQRIGIWAIAVLMIVSTIAMFVGMVLSMHNQSSDQQQQADTQKQIEEYQKQMEEQAKKNAAASEPLDGYKAESFDAGSVKSLKVEELKPGTGKAVTEGSKVTVNYFGWTPNGKIFDSTKKNGEVVPVTGLTIAKGQLIEGWVQGLNGVKEGAVVKLTIPAELGYGEQGSLPNIQPNEPLMFIIEVKKVQ